MIWAHNVSDLTLTSSVPGGSIEGGKANNGGAIHIPSGNTVRATNVTDVTALTDIILGGNNILKVVVNGAEGLTFSGGGIGPARARNN